ncbi:MAG TPA: YpdA family putative bacillithiol disulfide reductase [Gemmatimonadales bacterium]|nr:YpdA family putative bacillithiol disulfide reductase [Gemmatimonadales bacterium]
MTRSESTQLLVVGAGPIGLCVGIAARRAGIACVLVDRRTVVSTIERYPLNMTFFSTPERIEIGGVPFISGHEKPNRRDALLYYRRVAEHFALDVRVKEEVTALRREPDGCFRASVRARGGDKEYLAPAVVVATGYYDTPNPLGVPGEDLPHVAHYFVEGHRYWRQRVVVIGAGNSAVDAALESWRAGATVTLVHFDEGLDRTVKPWVLPDITNRIKEGSIGVRWRARVRAITPTHVELRHADGGTEELPADAVLAMTGFHADTRLLEMVGVPVDPATGIPAHDERTMETPVPGCFLAGVVASGKDANRLFIENSRVHGELIVNALKRRGM